jgi:hypothetical protein
MLYIIYFTLLTYLFNRRAILVDWLLGVQGSFGLDPSTFWVGLAMLDRMLSREIPEKATLQCLGIACLLLASKIEDRSDRCLR